MTNPSGHFYQSLKPMRTPAEVFDPASYLQAPADWLIAVSDIQGSTAAVAAGHHADVNFAAAAMIAALTNLCGSIPYQFGGDGAVALVPPEFEGRVRLALAQTRSFAAREFKLNLRIGLVAVQALLDRNAAVLVGRYEPSPGNAYAVFLGDGVDRLERAIKDRGDSSLRDLADIGPTKNEDGSPDLTGLSCRWTPLRSARGKMVSLVVRGADHGALHIRLAEIAGVEALNAASLANLETRWPPKGLMREAKARRRGASLLRMAIRVAYETFLAFIVIRFRMKVGRFDTDRYRAEIVQNAVNFARSGENLCLVFDCPEDRVEALRGYLDGRADKGELTYGLHISDHAVMTCLVASADDNQHVHFIDGGDGGYTRAATQLKARSATMLADAIAL
ncbi:MAG: DUF3095 family protein [Rhodospirillaceae bacterium]